MGPVEMISGALRGLPLKPWIAVVVCLMGIISRTDADAAYDAAIIGLTSEQTVSLSGLWNVKAFVALSSKGRQSIDDSIAFLAGATHSAPEKRMAVISMYPLPLEEYCRFLRELVELYNQDAIDDDLLTLAVNVPAAFSVELQKNYRNDDVKNTLEAVKSLSGTSSHAKSSISSLLSGDTWARTKSFCRELIFTRAPDCRNLTFLDLL